MSNESTKQETPALALATCSLPVSLVEELTTELIHAAEALDAVAMHRAAARCRALAQDLTTRARMTCANVRQPEENSVKDKSVTH